MINRLSARPTGRGGTSIGDVLRPHYRGELHEPASRQLRPLRALWRRLEFQFLKLDRPLLPPFFRRC